jgi:hypothetical protein
MAWTFYNSNGEAKKTEGLTGPGTLDTWHAIGAAGEPAFTNSWSNFTGYVAGFRKNPNGRIFLRGTVTGGTVTAAIFTLPVGYRPSQQHTFYAPAGVDAGALIVQTNGQVYINNYVGGSNAYVSLDGVHFDTDSVTQIPTTVTAVPTVTTLPTTGLLDGQDVLLKVDTAGTYGGPYFWPLRYDLSTASWIALGGEPLEIRPEWGTDRTTTSTTYTGSIGQAAFDDIVVPTSGLYRIDWGAGWFNDSNASASYMSLEIRNAANSAVTVAATDTDCIESFENAGAGISKSQSTFTKRTFAASGRARLMYRVAGGTGRARRRWMRITPVRLTTP